MEKVSFSTTKRKSYLTKSIKTELLKIAKRWKGRGAERSSFQLWHLIRRGSILRT